MLCLTEGRYAALFIVTFGISKESVFSKLGVCTIAAMQLITIWDTRFAAKQHVGAGTSYPIFKLCKEIHNNWTKIKGICKYSLNCR